MVVTKAEFAQSYIAHPKISRLSLIGGGSDEGVIVFSMSVIMSDLPAKLRNSLYSPNTFEFVDTVNSGIFFSFF
jgi:hypothetical protein